MENRDSIPLLTRAIHTELLSTIWMLIEFLVAFTAGWLAHSILLIAFGLDSLLEIISGAILIWRLSKERRGDSRVAVARAEAISVRAVGWILLLLAAYVTMTAGSHLVTHVAADASPSGLAIATMSVIFMPLLMIQKRHLGQRIPSAALVEDGLCNLTCAYMAGTVLVGALLTMLFNWWWADSAAALVLVIFIAREGLEGVRGEA